MTTFRFGIPDPNDDEQVVMQSYPARSGVIRHDEWRRHFPYGVFMDGAGGTVRVRDVNGSGTSLDSGNGGNLYHMLNHPDAGLIPNGLTYICWVNQQPWNFEAVQDNSANVIEACPVDIWQVSAPHDKLSAVGGDDLYSPRWFGTYPYDPVVHSEANALDLASDILTFYDDNPSVLAFSLGDDIETIENSPLHGTAVEAGILIRAMQSLDARPVTASVVSEDAVAEIGPTMKLHLSPLYPCGYNASAVVNPEGDLHRSTFNDLFAGADFVDVLASKYNILPENGRHWIILQTHQTIDDPPSSSQLRYPTPREIRLQTWEAVGEGMKGIFWFVYTDQLPNSDGLGSTPSAARLAAVAEMGRRLTPNIRQRLLRAEKIGGLFTATGGGLGVTYANAYISTLYDRHRDITYCVVCNHSTSTANVTIDSPTLTDSLRNLEDGTVIGVGDTISLPALDGTMFVYVPNTLSPLTDTMLLASDNAVLGCRWLRENALTYNGVAGNGAWEYNVTTDSVWLSNGTGPADDHDGNYGEAFKLHGLCLYYLRTHDASVIPDIEAQVQWHIDIEQALVAQIGSTYWLGSAPYWYWTSDIDTLTESGMAYGDPNTNGGNGITVVYNQQGMVRRWTSIDQMHMVGHGMYAYLYMLRNEAAITANTTLRAAALAYVGRMVNFETWQATHDSTLAQSSFPMPDESRHLDNLYKVAQGLTPTRNNGLTSVAPTYHGQYFDRWQVSNLETPIDPSSNSTIDTFMGSVYAPDTDLDAVKNYLRGRSMDMMIADCGHHDVNWDAAFPGPVPPYPKGWMLRSSLGGDALVYENPRTSASNNGYATDKHLIHIGDTGARDGLSGRGAQRMIALALHALIEPNYEIPLEIAPDGVTVLRSVRVRDAVDQSAETMAEFLPEPTTNANRFKAMGPLGDTGSMRSDVVDSAYTGYWMMACELWHLLNTGADYTDYYPIGLW